MAKHTQLFDSERYKQTDVANKGSRGFRNLLHFKKSEEGVAAIEFALIGPFFLMLIISITEMGIYFLMNRTVEASTDMISRKLKTNEILDGIQLSDLRQHFCDLPTMKIFDCDDVLIDVKEITKFGAPAAGETNDDGSLDSSGFSADLGPRGTLNIIRVFVRWPSLQSWVNVNSKWVDGKRMIMATNAFLKES